MKTLDEIIKRDDYARVNDALINRAQELAAIVRKKMEQLDMYELYDRDGQIELRICTVKSNSGYSTEYLALVDENDFYKSLETTETYYFVRDFNCRIEGATSKQYLQFINACRRLLNELDELETKKTEECSKALESVKDL